MIYVFDVDNTLTPPRGRMTQDFADTFSTFCARESVYLVTGANLEKLREQIADEMLCGCTGVFTDAGSHLVVAGRTVFNEIHEFPPALQNWAETIIAQSRYPVRRGRHIEQRTAGLNISTVGRAASRQDRKAYQLWDKVNNERAQICRELEAAFPEYEASAGGEISIDIAPRGWNKARVLPYIEKQHPGAPVTFVGDGMHPGGNDLPLAKAVRASNSKNVVVEVGNFLETFEFLRALDRQARSKSA